MSLCVQFLYLCLYPCTLDCYLTMNAHDPTIARTCYLKPRHLASIRLLLTSTATATLVIAFILTRNMNCNTLSFCSTHDETSHLQRIRKYAAQIISRLQITANIAIHLILLH